jgi:PQQ-like domain
MKIQCDCGAKYAIDATPEMARHPVKFACPECGVDLSARLDEAVRQEFNSATSTAPGVAPAMEIAPPPATSVPPPPVAPRVRISHGAAHASAAPEVVDARFCPKHPQQRVTEKCHVCGKGICPKCMQLFGYVCSPRCKEKADLQGLEIPVFAGQRDVAQNREWGKIALIAKLAALFLVILAGVWVWYSWFGSRPKPVFAVRFEDETAMSGESAVCDGGQIVFIHGAKLARYDLKSKKQIWLRHLVDPKQIAEQAAAEIKDIQAANAKSEFTVKIPSLDELTKDLARGAEQDLKLKVRGQNIWVGTRGIATRYDWDTGEPKQTVDINGGLSAGIHHGDEIEMREASGPGRLAITRFNLATGKVGTAVIGELPKLDEAKETGISGKTNTPTKTPPVAAKTPTRTGSTTKQLDPQQLGSAVAGASLPARLAAPATIATALNQQRTMQAMEDADPVRAKTATVASENPSAGQTDMTIIPTPDGFLQFTTTLLEHRIVERNAMKAPPKKSALNGSLSVTATADVANELLNDMQRDAGGGIVREDASRYLVKLHLGGTKTAPDWETNVVGPPAIYPQATVNVVIGGKTLFVLDKSNWLKWQTTLNYPMAGGGSYFENDEDAMRTGLGPVVERGNTLYVFDEGVLSAFDQATGNARWRLPSVGISNLFFDDDGNLYVNTTTASPEKIKFSKQIDVNDRTDDVVIKLDARTGREIWKHSMGGKIAYLAGKYIYTVSYLGPLDDNEELSPEMVAIGAQTKPYLRIRRINPKNGRVLWDYYEPRGPLDVKIHDNTFQVVLKKEVEVLKFMSF